MAELLAPHRGTDADDDADDEATEALIAAMGTWAGRDEYLAKLMDDDDGEQPLLAESAEDMDPALVEALILLRDGDEPASALAAAAKDRGNKHYATAVTTKTVRNTKGKQPKQKGKVVNWFREAAKEYTDGIALCCAAEHDESDSSEQEAKLALALKPTLLCNRAQCSLQLRNFGQAKRDCREALQLAPALAKAWFRLARACSCLEQWPDAVKACDFGLKEAGDEANSKALRECREKCVSKIAEQKAAERKDRAARKAREATWRAVYNGAANLGARLGPTEGRHAARPEGAKVAPHFDDDDTLRWPVLFAYPEKNDGAMHPDLIESMSTQDVLAEWLSQLYPEQGDGPDWDRERHYQCSSVVLYARARAVAPFADVEEYVDYREKRRVALPTSDASLYENSDDDVWFEVSPASTLAELVGHPLHVAPPVITLEVRPRDSETHVKWRKHVESRSRIIHVGLRINPDGTLSKP